eukprot:scaffold96347_cov18-Tisochrysis_lutea.AAC.2
MDHALYQGQHRSALLCNAGKFRAPSCMSGLPGAASAKSLGREGIKPGPLASAKHHYVSGPWTAGASL